MEHPANLVKKSLKYFDITEGEEWRPPLVRELINIRAGQLDLQGFSKEEIKILLKNQCELGGMVFPLVVTTQFFLPHQNTYSCTTQQLLLVYEIKID